MEFRNWYAKHYAKSDLCNVANRFKTFSSRPFIHITLKVHCIKSNTFSPPWEPTHNSNTELSSCHLLLLCGNTENHAWEKTVTFDWHETRFLIIDNLSGKVKPEKEVVSAQHLLHRSNRACLKKIWTVQIMNPGRGTECSKWQRHKLKQGKELKERKMLLLLLSLLLSPHTLSKW